MFFTVDNCAGSFGVAAAHNLEKNKIINQARAIIAGRVDLVVIGIAGSYGKSGAKELLAHILSQKYKVLKTRANQNTEMGVSQTVINDLNPNINFCLRDRRGA